jgi:large subunit ribosomal protein L31
MNRSLDIDSSSIEQESDERNGHLETTYTDLRPDSEKRWKKEYRDAGRRLDTCELKRRRPDLKTAIHPELHLAHVTCATCGTELTTRWTAGDLTVETCSQCHPAYTGRRTRATGGNRIERFERKRAAALQ